MRSKDKNISNALNGIRGHFFQQRRNNKKNVPMEFVKKGAFCEVYEKQKNATMHFLADMCTQPNSVSVGLNCFARSHSLSIFILFLCQELITCISNLCLF